MQEKDGSYRHATADEIANRKSQIQNLTVIAWLWARTVASPNPAAKGGHVPLVRSFWLSTKAGKKAWVEPVVDQKGMTYRFEVRSGKGEPRAGTVNRNGGICLLTDSPIPFEYVRAEGKAGRLRPRLMAIVADGKATRVYLSATAEQEQIAGSAAPKEVPDTDLPEGTLGFRVQAYGMTKHHKLFTRRQLVLLTTMSGLVLKAATDSCQTSRPWETEKTITPTRLRRIWLKDSVNSPPFATRWHTGAQRKVSPPLASVVKRSR